MKMAEWSDYSSSNLTATGYGGGSVYKVPTCGPTTGGTNNMGNGIWEVAFVTEDEDGNTALAFGPKAYAASNSENAIAQAAVEAASAGVAIDANTTVRTRFFG